MFRFTIRDMLWLTVVASGPADVLSAEWGDVSIRFVFGGALKGSGLIT